MRINWLIVGSLGVVSLAAFTALAQSQLPSEKQRLTVVCYWQNYEEKIFSHLSSYPVSDGCEKYKDPTHCRRTAPEMLADANHDWERVTADGLIYTITCKRNCKRIPVAGENFETETDGKWMWIRFEKPDKKDVIETFEIVDVSPMAEEDASGKTPQALPAETETSEPTIKVSTGFFVDFLVHILTNAHVVSRCKQIHTRGGLSARLVSKDDEIDLALLKVETEPPAVATFRVRPEPRVGDSVISFGFPLQGILSSEGNLTTGTVAARTGIGDDPRFIQVSAPIQSGNSGSPLLDSSGDVIGVMEAKLDAAAAFQISGDIPQNVNFAIRASEAMQFLERNDVPYHAQAAESILDLKVADVAARAKQFSVPLECVE